MNGYMVTRAILTQEPMRLSRTHLSVYAVRQLGVDRPSGGTFVVHAQGGSNGQALPRLWFHR